MGKQSRGICRFCQAEYTKSGMLKHVAACKERAKEVEKQVSVKPCGYFTLSVTGRHYKNYWLVIECKESALLKDVDQFLRDIWLECCGHLSAFTINGESYESNTEGSGIWGIPAKSMKHKLGSVLSEGMSILYEYDFGSTTELMITVSQYRIGSWGKDKINLLARNKMIEFICSECGKNKAVGIHSECSYDGECYLCEECAEKLDVDDYDMLSVCNSPRCGVCGYVGSIKYGD